ncbi:type IV pilus modification protein PilV [Acinetobacter haemolyticus]|uniref:type IV pilus modification protein PilV n=1 Tax=Acinetobacter haemolyticus TaxID=29430 RepID=UPI00148AD377|nr:type IV pilus modification protein PilV [Acinetobacter haemolyticus]
MKTISKQKGVGLIEVLVSLLILAVGILGFVALQYRAVEATSEAINRVQAINIARDMAERIRANRDGLETYKTQIQADDVNQTNFTTDCIASACNATAMADFDVSQVVTKASSLGMTMNMRTCSGNSDGRNCIYVAWGDTRATDGTGAGHCTNGTAYQASSTCVIMETY